MDMPTLLKGIVNPVSAHAIIVTLTILALLWLAKPFKWPRRR